MLLTLLLEYSSPFYSCRVNLVRFLQIHIFIRFNTSSFHRLSDNKSMGSLFSFNPPAKAAILFVYDYLSSLQNTSLFILRCVWEKDLGCPNSVSNNPSTVNLLSKLSRMFLGDRN